MSTKDVIYIWNNFGIVAIVVLLLIFIVIWLIRVLVNEDRSSLWRARIYFALFKLSGRREAEKKYISNDVRGRINIARRQLHAGKATLPKAVSVDWVEEGGPSSYYVAEGEFVVKLNRSHEQEKNIVDLTLAVIRRSTLLGVRSVIDRPLKLGIDLCLARNVLQILHHKAALDWFLAINLSRFAAPIRGSLTNVRGFPRLMNGVYSLGCCWLNSKSLRIAFWQTTPTIHAWRDRGISGFSVSNCHERVRSRCSATIYQSPDQNRRDTCSPYGPHSREWS